VRSFAEEREQREQDKRNRRHQAIAAPLDPAVDGRYVCAVCGFACRSRIGLVSHERACRRDGD
jgi:hypothetical protein